MLAYIKGKVVAKKDNWLIIETNDLGYQIFLSQKLLDKTILQQELTLYLYQHQTQDNSSLYGFADLAELEMFKMLLNVSGIGPKSALSVLNKAQVAEIAGAIIAESPEQLKIVTGISPKSAERIVVELKTKMSKLTFDPSEISAAPKDSEIIEALISLGYQKQQIQNIIKLLPKDQTDISSRLKAALQLLHQ